MIGISGDLAEELRTGIEGEAKCGVKALQIDLDRGRPECGVHCLGGKWLLGIVVLTREQPKRSVSGEPREWQIGHHYSSMVFAGDCSPKTAIGSVMTDALGQRWLCRTLCDNWSRQLAKSFTAAGIAMLPF